MEEANYGSLAELLLRKRQLKRELKANEKVIGTMWSNLFHTGKAKSVPTPSKRLSNAFSIGASVLDGAILGWKLYRRFKK